MSPQPHQLQFTALIRFQAQAAVFKLKVLFRKSALGTKRHTGEVGWSKSEYWTEIYNLARSKGKKLIVSNISTMCNFSGVIWCKGFTCAMLHCLKVAKRVDTQALWRSLIKLTLIWLQQQPPLNYRVFWGRRVQYNICNIKSGVWCYHRSSELFTQYFGKQKEPITSGRWGRTMVASGLHRNWLRTPLYGDKMISNYTVLFLKPDYISPPVTGLL